MDGLVFLRHVEPVAEAREPDWNSYEARALRVADAIENDAIYDLTFNMRTFGDADVILSGVSTAGPHMCKTPACVGGYAAYMAAFEGQADPTGGASGDERIVETARRYLGLDPLQACQMFTPGSSIAYASIRPQEAVSMLRGYAETGEVRWPHSIRWRSPE